MPMNLSEMATVSNATVAMAFHGSGSPREGRRVFVGAAVDVKAPGLRKCRVSNVPKIARRDISIFYVSRVLGP